MLAKVAVKVAVKNLNQQHQVYSLYADIWEQLELLNAGGIRIALAADRFLMKRPKEAFDVYQERMRRFRYQNILGTVLGWYNAQLFRQNPHIELKRDGKPNTGTPSKGNGVDAWYTDVFLANCDRAGTTLIDAFRQVFYHLSIYGASYVLVDKPHADAPVESRADEKDLGLDAPYLVIYSPGAE